MSFKNTCKKNHFLVKSLLSADSVKSKHILDGKKEKKGGVGKIGELF